MTAKMVGQAFLKIVFNPEVTVCALIARVPSQAKLPSFRQNAIGHFHFIRTAQEAL